MEINTKGYSVEQVIDLIKMLSQSQGFYGRLLEEIMYIKEYDPISFEVFADMIEKEEFENPVDVVLFFEG